MGGNQGIRVYHVVVCGLVLSLMLEGVCGGFLPPQTIVPLDRFKLRRGLSEPLVEEGAATWYHYTTTASRCPQYLYLPLSVQGQGETDDKWDEATKEDTTQDTVRVRIWRILADGQERSLVELGVMVGERRLGELKAHLQHVEKQAKTLQNKKASWRERRGIDTKTKKLRLLKRRGDKNVVYIRLG